MAKKKVFQISNALGEGLEETIGAAQNYSGELRIEVIPLKKIEVDPDNPRDLSISFEDVYSGIQRTDSDFAKKGQELLSLQSLAHSIREQGIINPIVVYKFGEKYRLVAGERRSLASILAGKIDIQAKILDSKPNELKISLLQWIENIERSDLSLWERLKNLEKIVTAFSTRKNIGSHEVTVTELSHLIGCTKPHAMNYKAVLNADEKLKQLIYENKIKNLEKAALIADVTNEALKQNLMEACIAGAPLKKLKIIIDQNKEKKIIKKVAETRGRQSSSFNLGTTKNLKVAKLILDSILKNEMISHISERYKNVDWNDFRSVTSTFKDLMKQLEQLNS